MASHIESKSDTRVINEYINDRFSSEERLKVENECKRVFSEFDNNLKGTIVTNPHTNKEYLVFEAKMLHVFSHEHVHLLITLVEIPSRCIKKVEYCKGYFYWEHVHISSQQGIYMTESINNNK